VISADADRQLDDLACVGERDAGQRCDVCNVVRSYTVGEVDVKIGERELVAGVRVTVSQVDVGASGRDEQHHAKRDHGENCDHLASLAA